MAIRRRLASPSEVYKSLPTELKEFLKKAPKPGLRCAKNMMIRRYVKKLEQESFCVDGVSIRGRAGYRSVNDHHNKPTGVAEVTSLLIFATFGKGYLDPLCRMTTVYVAQREVDLDKFIKTVKEKISIGIQLDSK